MRVSKTQNRTLYSSIIFVILAVTTACQAENPYTKPDNSWISLNGTVVSAQDDRFLLDYGESLITVEMDDWDWHSEGSIILEGDHVSVYGKVDNDLYENRSIEASSVFVKGLNTYFYASPADEENELQIGMYNFTLPSENNSRVNLTGTVKSISGRKFILDTGPGTIKIDTGTMRYNPLDSNGYQKLKNGDLVSVGGYLDLDFFDKREIQATSIVTLRSDHKNGSS